MAKKKIDLTAMAAAPQAPGIGLVKAEHGAAMKQLKVAIPATLHAAFKKAAALDEATMADLVAQGIQSYLEDFRERRPEVHL